MLLGFFLAARRVEVGLLAHPRRILFGPRALFGREPLGGFPKFCDLELRLLAQLRGFTFGPLA